MVYGLAMGGEDSYVWSGILDMPIK
ncbi:uncharacterized protein G2W53_015542 [Senna tora]|uniref:Uncharacterized protein n=1 Tax=Senna tora TaxID=362788 RepID=A0A834WVU3_9FABA|nr:uncharacterized protein G2W53_015542 [Senna tora]